MGGFSPLPLWAFIYNKVNTLMLIIGKRPKGLDYLIELWYHNGMNFPTMSHLTVALYDAGFSQTDAMLISGEIYTRATNITSLQDGIDKSIFKQIRERMELARAEEKKAATAKDIYESILVKAGSH